MTNRAIFLDRDGTIIEDLNYLSNPDHANLIPGIIDTLKILQTKFKLIIISNQSGINRGKITSEQFKAVHFKVISLLKEHDIKIDFVYYCPHKPEEHCICRKPSPTMFFWASSKYKIDLTKSYMIGDRLTDIEAGKNAGCKTILFNNNSVENFSIKPDFLAKTWQDILEYIWYGKENNLFNRDKLILKSLSERKHDYNLSNIKKLTKTSLYNNDTRTVAIEIIKAKKKHKEIIFMMGAHVIKTGMQKYIIDLLKRGYITCIATNGACLIHDYEFSLIGATSENVSTYISDGQFGLWKETGNINEIINKSFLKKEYIGIGEAVGKEIWKSNYPNKKLSIFGTCFSLNIPITVHVGIGYDIIHEHPNFNGAATGEMSYTDFLKFTNHVSKLENGVLMSFGSATMAPEVFLKALSMSRNVSNQKSEKLNNFTTLVCDLHDLPENINSLPMKDEPLNFFRPWKTILVRTIADGGKSFYLKGRHEKTIPSLWSALMDLEKELK